MEEIDLSENRVKVDLLKELGDKYGNDGAVILFKGELIDLSEPSGCRIFNMPQSDFEVSISTHESNGNVFYVFLTDDSDLDIDFDLTVILHTMSDVDNLINICKLFYESYKRNIK